MLYTKIDGIKQLTCYEVTGVSSQRESQRAETGARAPRASRSVLGFNYEVHNVPAYQIFQHKRAMRIITVLTNCSGLFFRGGEGAISQLSQRWRNQNTS